MDDLSIQAYYNTTNINFGVTTSTHVPTYHKHSSRESFHPLMQIGNIYGVTT